MSKNTPGSDAHELARPTEKQANATTLGNDERREEGNEQVDVQVTSDDKFTYDDVEIDVLSLDFYLSTTERCHVMLETPEAYVITEHILRHPRHPLRDDKRFRSSLLGDAAQVLFDTLARGDKPVYSDGFGPRIMTLIGALWCAEYCNVHFDFEAKAKRRDQRLTWLKKVKTRYPICFDEDSQQDSIESLR